MPPPLAPRSRLVLAGLSILLVAACSGGGGGAPEGSERATSATAPPTDAPATDPPATGPPVTGQVVATSLPATDPPTTDPATTDPAGTPAPRDLSFLWVDGAEMAEAWDAANAVLAESDPTVSRIELDAGDLRVAPLASAGDGFAALEVFPAGFLSGTIDPGGEVSALVVTVDPADATARSAVSSSLGALIATWSAFGVDGGDFLVAAGESYDELAAAPLVADDQRFVPGPVGLSYVGVLSVVGGDAGGPDVIELAVIPLPDEEAALAIVELLRLELRAVTG